MSFYDYKKGREIEAGGYPFYAIIQAAMRQADSDNLEKLSTAFPEVRMELQMRYNLPGGMTEKEHADELARVAISVVSQNVL